jgi:hypothetical protein
VETEAETAEVATEAEAEVAEVAMEVEAEAAEAEGQINSVNSRHIVRAEGNK